MRELKEKGKILADARPPAEAVERSCWLEQFICAVTRQSERLASVEDGYFQCENALDGRSRVPFQLPGKIRSEINSHCLGHPNPACYPPTGSLLALLSLFSWSILLSCANSFASVVEPAMLGSAW